MKKAIYLTVLLLFAMSAMAQDAEMELFYPAEYAVVEIGMLTAAGRQVYQNGVRLTPDEVRGLMAGTGVVHLYNSGLRRFQIGNDLLWAGAGFIVGGGIIGGVLALSYGHNLDNIIMFTTIGSSAGAVLAVYPVIPGLILRNSGRRDIRTAVDMHNQNAHASNIKFNFGFTQNGIGMVVRF